MAFYRSLTENSGNASLQQGLECGDLTENDVGLIKAFVNSKTATRGWQPHRQKKSKIDLRQWQRFIKKPYRECNIDDIHSGINQMKNGLSRRGEPFAANTIHDYIKVLKWFLLWGIENKKFPKIKKAKIIELKVPPQNTNTTEPSELLMAEDIVALVEAAKGSQYPARDQAFIAVLYESGVRIGELATLYWRDVTPMEYGFRLFVKDHKTKKFRWTAIQVSAPYLSSWKNSYPGGAEPNKPAFISMWERKKTKRLPVGTENDKELTDSPMEYSCFYGLLKRIYNQSGLKKRVHCHLFRKSRITDMIRHNWQESIVKKSMWGNLNTKQFATYVVTNERDLDAEMMERSGFKPKEETSKDNPLTPKVCFWCKTVNETTHSFCKVCSRPLTDDVIKAVETARKQVNQATIAMTPEERSEWLTEQMNELTASMAPGCVFDKRGNTDIIDQEVS